MTIPRFFAAIGRDGTGQAELATVARRQGFAVAFRDAHLIVAVAPQLRTLPLGDAGVLLGRLHADGRDYPYDDLSREAAAAIGSSGGHVLTERWFGHYVAFIRQGSRSTLVRAPFGELPCLLQEHGNMLLVGSDANMLRLAGAPPHRIDRDAVVRHLIAPDTRHAQTCLFGVAELCGGERLVCDGATRRREALWSPWRFVAPDARIDDHDDAVRRLRDHAGAAIRAGIAGYRAPLLLLSGGLDSSLIASSLHASGLPFDCLNLTTRNPSGNEQAFARQVADHFGRSLIVEPSLASEVDLMCSAAASLPRPVARAFEQASYRSVARAAAAGGNDLLLDGGGGDNVFSSLQSAAPVADCLMDEAGRPHLGRVLATLTQLTGASALRLTWHGFVRSRRRGGYRWTPDTRLLSPAAARLAQDAVAHPWLAPPMPILPGKAGHVAMLIPAQGLVEDGPFGYPIPSISPLVSQPLIETCLRIPSWFWFDRGCNRAAAREAISASLPPAIAWRRDKGTPDGFLAELYEANRGRIRDALLGGFLAAEGLLDTEAIAARLADPAPVRDHGFVRILQLLDTEAWIRAVRSA